MTTSVHAQLQQLRAELQGRFPERRDVIDGALTAILWVWRPPVHLEIVADVPSGIRYLVDAARKADLPLPGTAEDLYRTLRPELEGAGALSAWGA